MTTTTNSTNIASKFLHCDCQHEFQDKMYGRGIRVHNQTKQSEKLVNRKYRCTVCGKERGA